MSDNGSVLIRVPLKGSKGLKGYAEINKDDWDFLGKLGASTAWNLSAYGTVIAGAARAPGRNVRIGRVLLDAGPGQIVRYRDGNPLNLRRSNLYLDKGSALGRDRLWLTPTESKRKKKRNEYLEVAQ